jgi:hypothetical protein
MRTWRFPPIIFLRISLAVPPFHASPLYRPSAAFGGLPLVDGPWRMALGGMIVISRRGLLARLLIAERVLSR